MTTLTLFTRRCRTFPVLLGASARKLWQRRDLTPQERANLLAAHTPSAIMTASLGGHPAGRW